MICSVFYSAAIRALLLDTGIVDFLFGYGLYIYYGSILRDRHSRIIIFLFS